MTLPSWKKWVSEDIRQFTGVDQVELQRWLQSWCVFFFFFGDEVRTQQKFEPRV